MDDLKTCAHHEAGHAVVARLLNVPMAAIILTQEKGCDDWSGEFVTGKELQAGRDRDILVKIALAGPLAEALFRKSLRAGTPSRLDRACPLAPGTADLIVRTCLGDNRRELLTAQFLFSFGSEGDQEISTNGIVGDLYNLHCRFNAAPVDRGEIEEASCWIAEQLNKPEVWRTLTRLAETAVDARGRTVGVNATAIRHVCREMSLEPLKTE